MPRHSKIQLQVLSLYKEFLRVTKNQSGFQEYVKKEFRKNASIPRTDFVQVEYLLHRGRRQLSMLKSSFVSGAGVFEQEEQVSKHLIKRSSSSVVKISSSLLLHQQFLDSLPDGIQMAFAYGSGVFQQEGHADITKNMLDFVIVVDDVESWHRKNLALNWKHYSALKLLGSKVIANIQEKYGAGIYFNTLVKFKDRLLKYGVISTRCLITDLLDWNSLYVSGRLHKPVKLIVQPDSKSVMSAMQMNLQSAVHAALLQLPETFSEEALYITIAGLSYGGDFRMTFGEDHNKVVNMVRPNIEHFRQLYEKILDSTEHLYWHRGLGRLEQPQSHVARFHHLQLLPKTVLLSLQGQHSQAYRNPDLEEVLRFYAHDTHCDEAVARCIRKTVRKSSWSQSLKTILSAGIRKSLVYSAKKMGKMVQGKQKPKESINYRQQ
ncbi:hypothetical protein C0Q70_13913 [Pomacea canaliculata]|uniref:Phosphatidate cytidylyltransferase, mitochondrial n=1 Tax=Pomacea canaliculata TaxID=400727 RepID=A0A2T7NYN3_POMCA|nr:hypothetical protein C0Q70_13913 [Pomacea canaliculata]